MRAAAYLAGSIVAIGIYLAIAAALAFTTAWIAVGALAIATGGAVGTMAGGRGPGSASAA